MAGDELALQVAEPRRLVISEMVLENFKSYAGVQRVGPFHKVTYSRFLVYSHCCDSVCSPCCHLHPACMHQNSAQQQNV